MLNACDPSINLAIRIRQLMQCRGPRLTRLNYELNLLLSTARAPPVALSLRSREELLGPRESWGTVTVWLLVHLLKLLSLSSGRNGMVTSSVGTTKVTRNCKIECLAVRNSLSYVVAVSMNSSIVLTTRHGSECGAASAAHDLFIVVQVTVVFSVVKYSVLMWLGSAIPCPTVMSLLLDGW